jgi:iron(III) transport system ATP-binding protein
VLAVLGKSTLLRIIAGLETGASGEIYIKGRLCQGKGVFIPPEKRNVGLVVQDYALFPFMTVEQNIRFGMKGKDDGKYNFLVELTHLNGLEKRYPHEISGGQQQRASLFISALISFA